MSPHLAPENGSLAPQGNMVRGNAETVVQAHEIHGGVGVRHEHLPRPALTAWDALPPLPPVLTGRDADLAVLRQALDPSTAKGGSVVVSSAAAAAVAGMGGVGKTALAATAASQALDQGWFAGVLWVDLHGYSPGVQVLTAVQALDILLRALGVEAGDLPPTLQEKQGLYRSALVEVAERRGGPLLVVADNAAAIDQVRPLLPGPGGSRLLATSRHFLSALTGARHLRLDALDGKASMDLLRALLIAADPVHPHLGDAVGLDRVAGLCAGLPLALEIAAGLMTRSARRTPTRLAEQLQSTSRVEYLHDRQDPERALRTVFDLSHAELSPDQARVFTLLGAAPGPTVSTAAASVLTGLGGDALIEILEDLAAAHLVTDHSQDDRWGMHDLLADYARARTVPGHRTALIRLLDHYTALTEAADKHLRTLPGRQAPDAFADRDDALAWLDAEHVVLVDAVRTAAEIGHTPTTIHLPLLLSEYLSWRRAFTDQITVSTIARDSAHATGDRHGQAGAWNNLGLALRQTRRFGEAVEAHTRARDLYDESGGRYGQAGAWNNLGLALQGVRRFGEAVEAHTRARDLYDESGDRHGQARAWNNLGLALQKARVFDDAVIALDRARILHAESGDRHREARAWNNLGLALQGVRRFGEAVEAHSRARALFVESGDRHREAGAWNNLGLALQGVRRFGEAVEAHTRARDLYDESGDRHSAAGAWNNLGLALEEFGGREKAVAAVERAAALYTETDDDRGQAIAQEFLDHLRGQSGDSAEGG